MPTLEFAIFVVVQAALLAMTQSIFPNFRLMIWHRQNPVADVLAHDLSDRFASLFLGPVSRAMTARPYKTHKKQRIHNVWGPLSTCAQLNVRPENNATELETKVFKYRANSMNRIRTGSGERSKRCDATDVQNMYLKNDTTQMLERMFGT